MLAYKPATPEEQKIIRDINKSTKQINYNSDWYIEREERTPMLLSSILFAVLLLIIFL